MGTLGLKIDVDTYWGMKNGVPRLLQTLNDFQVSATFFLSIGPDNSGRAVLQLIKNPLFLKKMLRTKAVSLYGWKTALYGILLPAPKIALSFPDIVRQIIQEGHEVQFHAWDHRRWQDELPKKPQSWIENWFESGINGFARLTGHQPSAFGAPAWLIDERVLEIIAKYRFEYLSCTRASSPFVHKGLQVLEIPSDLPCFEELAFENDVSTLNSLINNGGLHVLPVHAEVEGGIFEEKFSNILQTALASGVKITTLENIKANLNVRSLPVRKHSLTLLPGRSAYSAT